MEGLRKIKKKNTVKKIIFSIVVSLFCNINYSQSKIDDFIVFTKDTIFKSKENSFECFNKTNDTLMCQVSVIKRKKDKYRIIPDVLQFKTSVKQMNKWTVVLPNSSKKVVLDNLVLEKYNLKKGKYYLQIDVRHFVNYENSPYRVLKKKFYYKD
jgi:hypothetical protein